jgi:hypothetical protein
VRGAVDLSLDGHVVPLESDGFSLVRLDHRGSAHEIGVRALDDGAAVADLSVCARGPR